MEVKEPKSHPELPPWFRKLSSISLIVVIIFCRLQTHDNRRRQCRRAQPMCLLYDTDSGLNRHICSHRARTCFVRAFGFDRARASFIILGRIDPQLGILFKLVSQLASASIGRERLTRLGMVPCHDIIVPM